LTPKDRNSGISEGCGAKIIETENLTLGGVVCFDLNYRELKEQYRKLSPQILTIASMYHGGHVQKTWAYDCGSFMVSSCKDCRSEILDPLGQTLYHTTNYTPHLLGRINLDYVRLHLDENIEKFNEIISNYGTSIKIDIPEALGTCILYSESPKFSAMDIVREFDLELLDQYLHRNANPKLST
jgi:hypothetical protein